MQPTSLQRDYVPSPRSHTLSENLPNHTLLGHNHTRTFSIQHRRRPMHIAYRFAASTPRSRNCMRRTHMDPGSGGRRTRRAAAPSHTARTDIRRSLAIYIIYWGVGCISRRLAYPNCSASASFRADVLRSDRARPSSRVGQSYGYEGGHVWRWRPVVCSLCNVVCVLHADVCSGFGWPDLIHARPASS